MPGDREYELKFSIDPAACEALVSHPALMPALRDRQLSHLSSTYFDTPDERLRNARVTLRVRKSEGGSVQTLKQAAHSIVDRAEWEHAVPGPRPDMAVLRETPLKALLDEVDGTLAPRFTVDVTRATFPLCHGADEIEAALDRGAIRADGLALEVSELELESKQGSPSALFDVARDLVADLPLVLSLASKSERGFAVAHLEWGRPTKDIDLALEPGMRMHEAFEAIVQACLHALTRNAALVAVGSASEQDGEAVHRSRIALRRLRAAFDLFAPVLRRKRAARLRREMRWIARRLGEARDADVLQVALLEPAARDPLLSGAPALAHVMSGRREAAHARLREALGSPRWRLLLVELLAFSLDGVRRSRRRRFYRGFVRRGITARRRDLARRVRGLRELPARALHDIRKDAKQLRYDLELFGAVRGIGAGRRGYARLRDGLEALQERLGLMQDDEAMRASLRAILDGERPAAVAPETWRSATSAARVLVAPRPAADVAMRKAAKAARRIRAAKPF